MSNVILLGEHPMATAEEIARACEGSETVTDNAAGSHMMGALSLIAAGLGVSLPPIRAKKPYNKGTGLQPWTGAPAPSKDALAAARTKGREKGRKQ